MNRRQVIAGCAACTAAVAARGAFAAAAVQKRYRDLQPDLTLGYRPDGKTAEAGLWMQVDEYEKAVRSSSYIIRDSELQSYLEDVLRRLGGDFCRDVRVYPMRIPYFNATMAPNGMMEVWSGLLLRVSSEAQLAAVLGHEFGHYLRRHSIKSWTNLKKTADFSAFLTLGVGAASVATGTYINADPLQFALLGSIFKFNRDMESEADAFGLELMTKANYNPSQAAVIWERLITESKAAKYKSQTDPFFSTHPSDETRVKNLKAHASEFGVPESSDPGDNSRFLRVTAKLRAMMIEDQLNLRQFGKTDLILNWLLADKLRVGETRYYLGENLRQRGEPGDIEKAKTHYLAAMGEAAAPPETHRALGMIYLKERNSEAARASFEHYLSLKPEATDGDMIRSYMGGSS